MLLLFEYLKNIKFDLINKYNFMIYSYFYKD